MPSNRKRGYGSKSVRKKVRSDYKKSGGRRKIRELMMGRKARR